MNEEPCVTEMSSDGLRTVDSGDVMTADFTVVTGTSSRWFCCLVAAPGSVLSSQVTPGIVFFLHLKQKRTEVVQSGEIRYDPAAVNRAKPNFCFCSSVH